MGTEVIKQLLEKYWQAETSLEEERVLAEYFRGPEVAEELESYRSLFDWIGEEAAVTAPAGLEEKLLAQIGGTRPAKKIQMLYPMAASLLLCVISIFLVSRTSEPEPAKVSHSAAAVTQQHYIKDTYEDPEKALAVVRQALMRVSVSMNEGKRITQKNMHLMDHSWQAAVSN